MNDEHDYMYMRICGSCEKQLLSYSLLKIEDAFYIRAARIYQPFFMSIHKW